MFSFSILTSAFISLIAVAAMATENVTPESTKIRPGDLERPIFVANSVQWNTESLLYMKLKPTLEVGTLELSHFYWNGFFNRGTRGVAGTFLGNVKIANSDRIYINRSNGYVYLGNELVGGIYRLANLNIVAVFFVAPINVDLTTDTLKFGTKSP